jgi:hypothetical protein
MFAFTRIFRLSAQLPKSPRERSTVKRQAPPIVSSAISPVTPKGEAYDEGQDHQQD